MKIITWNMAHRSDAWSLLACSDADIALLQEASEPPAAVATNFEVDCAPWQTGRNQRWRTAVVKLSSRAEVQWIEAKPLADAHGGELGVSRPGTLAAAVVTPHMDEPFTAISVYGCWETPHAMSNGKFIYADASVHRLISDLSVFVGKQTKKSILVAGDLNILYGYGERGDAYWAARYETVFTRMKALGLSFIGPQAPHGRLAEPWPAELPPTSRNVPTYHTTKQTPENCTRQLDFVFATAELASRCSVRALNETDQWGPSDHCRVEIHIA
jgi:endonuclease/exonuclease/phosphatase family metal-dependent hydrolase